MTYPKTLNEKFPLKQTRLHQASRIILGTEFPDALWNISMKQFQSNLLANINLHLKDVYAKVQKSPDADIESLEAHLLKLDGTIQSIGFSLIKQDLQRILDSSTVIGLNGSIGCGKDTLADHLVENHQFSKLSFSDPLRASASILFQVPMHNFIDRNLKEQPSPLLQGLSPRGLLQIMGTEICRAIRPDIWTQRLAISVAHRNHAHQRPKIVIADVRFPNEAAMVRPLQQGFVAKITRPTDSVAAESKGLGHTSEAGIGDFPRDLHIVNQGTLLEYLTNACQSFGLERPRAALKMR